MMRDAEEERAAVVEWLKDRGTDRILAYDKAGAHLIGTLAEAIERGDHRK